MTSADEAHDRPDIDPGHHLPGGAATPCRQFLDLYYKHYLRVVAVVMCSRGTTVRAAEEAAREAFRVAWRLIHQRGRWDGGEEAAVWIRSVALRHDRAAGGHRRAGVAVDTDQGLPGLAALSGLSTASSVLPGEELDARLAAGYQDLLRFLEQAIDPMAGLLAIWKDVLLGAPEELAQTQQTEASLPRGGESARRTHLRGGAQAARLPASPTTRCPDCARTG